MKEKTNQTDASKCDKEEFALSSNDLKDDLKFITGPKIIFLKQFKNSFSKEIKDNQIPKTKNINYNQSQISENHINKSGL